MNWFKKSIAYDQKRRLMFLPIFIILPIILNLMSLTGIIKSGDKVAPYNSLMIGIGYTGFLVAVGITALIAVVSIGIRDKSEINYMESMPMKAHDVVMTKITCACSRAILPLLVGFILSTVVYITNKGFLVGEGYLYLDIVYRYILLIIIAFIIIGVVYLASLLYKNIKVSIALGVIGVVSTGYLMLEIGQCFKYDSAINTGMTNIVEGVVGIFNLPVNPLAVYYPSTIGSILLLLGIGVLIFSLIDYITSNFNNDIYDNLFSFKVSKVIYYIVSVLAIMSVFHFAIDIVVEYAYLDPLRRTTENISEEKFLLVQRIEYIAMVVLLPIWVFISRKIGKKLEERF